MPNFRIDEAYLIGGILAAAFWGAFTVLFVAAVYFIATKRRGDLYKPTTVLIVVMYTLATTHAFLALVRLITAFVTLQEVPGPMTPIVYLGNIGVPINRVKDLIYITNNVLGDSVVVWRCYAVWGRNKYVIALPIMLVLGTTISGYGAIHQYFLIHPSLAVAEAWGTSMFIISFVTNVLVTFLTAGRIWYLSRQQASASSSFAQRYRTVILLIIESGAVIAIAKTTEFTLFEVTPGGVIGNHALYIVYEIMPQITGIMPTLIVVLVTAGITSVDTHVQAKGMRSTIVFQNRSKAMSGLAPASVSKRLAPAFRSSTLSAFEDSDAQSDMDMTGISEVEKSG